MRALFIFVIATGFLYFVNGCKKGMQPSGNALTKSELKDQTDANGFKLPDGTLLNEVKDATGEIVRVDFTLPEHCKIAGTTMTGESISESGGSLTCTCNGNGGCKPFVAAGSKIGCLIDGCSKCTGTTAARMSGKELDFFFIQRGEIGDMDGLALLGDTRAIYSFEEWQSTAFVTAEEVASPNFLNALDELIQYCEPFGNKDIVAIAYMVGGKKFLVNVPYASLADGTLYTNAISGGNYKCSGSCNNGATRCKLETGAMGQVAYCDGCQSGCTLSMSK